MQVVDASCLIELVTEGGGADGVRAVLDPSQAIVAPHVIDVEVFGVVRRDLQRGLLDQTQALLAVRRMQAWPGERFPHTGLLPRAWELRGSMRGWDAMYVALAELLGATLVTLDRRLAAAPGPRCPIVVPR